MANPLTNERSVDIDPATVERHAQYLDGEGCFDAAEALRALRLALTARDELIVHLRHCRECGEMDVAHCHEGNQLWEVAYGEKANG